jgi:hypothetical protein
MLVLTRPIHFPANQTELQLHTDESSELKAAHLHHLYVVLRERTTPFEEQCAAWYGMFKLVAGCKMLPKVSVKGLALAFAKACGMDLFALTKQCLDNMHPNPVNAVVKSIELSEALATNTLAARALKKGVGSIGAWSIGAAEADAATKLEAAAACFVAATTAAAAAMEEQVRAASLESAAELEECTLALAAATAAAAELEAQQGVLAAAEDYEGADALAFELDLLLSVQKRATADLHSAEAKAAEARPAAWEGAMASQRALLSAAADEATAGLCALSRGARSEAEEKAEERAAAAELEYLRDYRAEHTSDAKIVSDLRARVEAEVAATERACAVLASGHVAAAFEALMAKLAAAEVAVRNAQGFKALAAAAATAAGLEGEVVARSAALAEARAGVERQKGRHAADLVRVASAEAELEKQDGALAADESRLAAAADARRTEAAARAGARVCAEVGALFGAAAAACVAALAEAVVGVAAAEAAAAEAQATVHATSARHAALRSEVSGAAEQVLRLEAAKTTAVGSKDFKAAGSLAKEATALAERAAAAEAEAAELGSQLVELHAAASAAVAAVAGAERSRLRALRRRAEQLAEAAHRLESTGGGGVVGDLRRAAAAAVCVELDLVLLAEADLRSRLGVKDPAAESTPGATSASRHADTLEQIDGAETAGKPREAQSPTACPSLPLVSANSLQDDQPTNYPQPRGSNPRPLRGSASVGALPARYTHFCICACPCSACCGFGSLLWGEY